MHIVYSIYAYVCQQLGTFSLYYDAVSSSCRHNHYNKYYCASVVEITMWSTIECGMHENGMFSLNVSVYVRTYVRMHMHPNLLLVMTVLTGGCTER